MLKTKLNKVFSVLVTATFAFAAVVGFTTSLTSTHVNASSTYSSTNYSQNLIATSDYGVCPYGGTAVGGTVYGEEECVDTDGDGTADYIEVQDGTDPANPCDPDPAALQTNDCDGDGVPLSDDPDDANQCVPTPYATTAEVLGSYPDCDNDGVDNDTDPDDGDVCNPNTTDPSCDTDNDGVPNSDDTGPNDPCVPDNTIGLCDADNDGLTNKEEQELGTDPNSACDPNDVSKGSKGFIADCDYPVCLQVVTDNDMDGVSNVNSCDNTDPDDSDPCIPNTSSPMCDSDNDGFNDKEDKCPLKLSKSNNGCPETNKATYNTNNSNNNTTGNVVTNTLAKTGLNNTTVILGATTILLTSIIAIIMVRKSAKQ